MNEIDHKFLKLENKVKKEFKEFFEWWEMISLKVVGKNENELAYNRRKRDLEIFYGEVMQSIEEASYRKLDKIVKSKRPIAQLYKELEIREFKFAAI